MKLNSTNYFQQIDSYMDIIRSDADFEATYRFINKVTKNGKEPQNLNKSPEIKETFNLFLQNLNSRESKQKKTTAKKAPDKQAKKPLQPKQETTTKVAKGVIKPTPKKKPVARHKAVQVAHIPSDIVLVKKYLGLHDKEKTYEQLLAIWRAFNKAIVERKVMRGSPYQTDITAMNNSLLMAIDRAAEAGSIHLTIPEARLQVYQEIAHSVERSAGVGILIEYINISGKAGIQERAEKLLRRIEKAAADGHLKTDRYAKEVNKAKAVLKACIDRETNMVDVSTYSLSGIGELSVFGCTCEDGLDGFNKAQNAVIYKLMEEKVKNLSDDEFDRAFGDTVAPSLCKAIAHKLVHSGLLTMSLLRNPARVARGKALAGTSSYDMETELMDMRLKKAGRQPYKNSPAKTGLHGTGETEIGTAVAEDVRIISAKELVSKQFRTIGLKGKYRQLLGDPEPGFSAMIYGKPKQGKSTVAIDLAKELTKHGKVLYCAFEEGHGLTLKDKVVRNHADVPGLDFADKLPPHIKSYQYVFIDSVSDAGLDEQAFKQLIKSSKPSSVIGIFHATKDGKFRGGQTYAHDVDVLIRVEDGVAYAQGRFAPPGEMNIAPLHTRL
ncbi:hypothetical protein CAP35_01270 [Chitinophagaceae bacterium IBVUCB1]|nr:hypothetical protein CAP35_01270 [Chitinophagaceae bacterium IBVUCB1]